MDCIWQQQLEQRLKYERSLNFSTLPGSEDDFNCTKKKVSRDPMSHRIIEKRRRDRMNNCLADLSRLIPSNYLKKGRGRIEKTEIIEMAIKHLKQLQAHKCVPADVVNGLAGGGPEPRDIDETTTTAAAAAMTTDCSDNLLEQYRLGYQECVSETMHFLVELEGLYPGDSLCIRLMNHLQKHCGRMVNGSHRMGDQMDAGFGTRCHQEDRSASPSSVSRPLSQSPSDAESPSKNLNVESVARIKLENKEDVSPEVLEPTCLKVINGNRQLNVDDVRGSQLREMLQNPSPTTKIINNNNNQATCGLQRSRSLSLSSSRPVSTTSSSGSSIRGDEVYKFKRNIKERFKADQQQGGRIDMNGCDNHYHHHHHHHHLLLSDGEASSTATDTINVQDRYQQQQQQQQKQQEERWRRRHDEDISETPEESSTTPETKFTAILLKTNFQDSLSRKRSRPTTSPETTDVPIRLAARESPASKVCRTQPSIRGYGTDVPIFALHPKGDYYVPMSVDASLILPYMMLHRHNTVAVDEIVLHHVGIAVYFRNGTTKIPAIHRILQETMSRPPSNGFV